MKQELGLDHFGDDPCKGLHHHALMTMIACRSSSIGGLQQRGGKKESTGRDLRQLCTRALARGVLRLRSRRSLPVAS